jgi:intracellular multiplication protein IcmO
MAKNIRGIEASQEVASRALWRDTRTYGQRFASWIESPDSFLMILVLCVGIGFVAPAFTLVSAGLGLWLCWYSVTRQFKLPFRMPKTSGLPDYNDPKPGGDMAGKAAGIAYLGNELNSRKELWFKNDDMRTHLLIFGSTGAGKTEALLSIAFNALVHASGFIYVDGKGDSSLFAKIYSMARFMGREDDLLVINYMTGSRDVFGPQSTKLSNTLNPFTTGSSGGLTELLVSLMDDSGGDNAMWKGRAISLISSIMMALVNMRENKEILLDVDVIREHLILENIIKLSKRRDLPAHVNQSIRAYLRSLPGYQDNAPKQSETVMDQHGYLQMQFTKILGSLADSYGYIFRTNLGEVDFWDVVANRRILVVLLPALEKSPEELANLGKIIVACLKQMMATGLGSLLEGEYKKIIETKPTYSPTPFLCILDEYGYYAVKGAAVMPAQARSLGFCMIFAGQDYPAFEKASKEEAASTVANCNIKIFMKLEDPKETYDLFHKLVGEAETTKVAGFQNNTSAFVSNYADMQNANVERRSRGDLLDLKDQREGEAHIIFKASVIRAQMFYADPKPAPKLQLNYFLKIEPPEKAEVLEMDSGLEDLMRRLSQPVFMKDLEDSTDPIKDIDLASSIMRSHASLGLMERACAAVAVHHNTVKNQMDDFRNQMGMLLDDDEDEDESVSVFNSGEANEDDEPKTKRKDKGSRYTDDEDDFEHPEDDEDFPVFLNESKTKSGLADIERLGGASEEQANESAERIVEDMKAISQYPHAEAPEDKSPDDILEMLKELDDKIDELEQENDD